LIKLNTFKTFKPLIGAILLLIVLQSCKPSGDAGHIISPEGGGDSLRVNQLIKKGRAFENTNFDSLIPLKNELYRIGKRTNNKKAIVFSEIYDAYYNWMAANHSVAMQAAIQALSDAERWEMDDVLPRIYSIMANLHKESSNYKLAFKEIDKGIQAAKFNKDTAEIIATLGNKAMFTHSYYNYSDQPQNDHTSLNLQLSALKMAESSPKFERMRIRFYNNIAQTYKERKDYDKALSYGNKAVELSYKYNQPRSLTYSYCWLGESYYYMGQHQKGMNYLNKAIAICTQIKEPYRRMEINYTVYECYRSTGDFEKALAAYTHGANLKDSLQVIKNANKLNELQSNYEAAKKDKQIAVLNQLNILNKRYVWGVTISALVFLALFILILFQYFIIRKNNKHIEGRNTGLSDALTKIAFIQSHEIRKPLSTLLGIMNLIKEEDYKAGKEVLVMMEKSAQDLDNKICQIVKEVEGK
jgi:tetratricopeptide (TPR) repeat protein